MKDKLFESVIDEIQQQKVPLRDGAHRKESIKTALSEFSNLHQAAEQTAASQNSSINNEENLQGNSDKPRPMVEQATKASASWLSTTTNFLKDFIMNPKNNRIAYSALGSFTVAFVAISLFYVMPSTRTETDPVTIGKRVIESNQSMATKNIPEPEESLEEHKALLSESIIGTAKQQKSEIKNKLSDGDSTEELVKKVAKSPMAEPMSAPKKSLESEPIADYSASLSSSDIESIVSNTRPASTQVSTPRLLAKKAPSVNRSIQESYSPAPEPGYGRQVDLDQGEEYADFDTSSIKLVSEEPVSTFSIDVDTASYSLVRNQLNNGYLPKPQAVRPEEFINYFNYDYEGPKSKRAPFETNLVVTDSPWNEGRKLIHIGIKGYELSKAKTPDSNLVFLLDVSGSMSAANKLPLVKQSISLLLDSLKPTDTISIVVYAGAAGTVLEPTKVREKTKILEALRNLNAGGSTAGGAGIRLAYSLAEQNFNKDAVNRIILATDGDFNVGQSSNEDLKTLVERKRESGVMLSVLGFGRNNYQDDMMQTLAQNGNGVAVYIDSLSEARKALVTEANSNLFTIAKDVKIQVEFNPTTVSEYRLVGYETRHLNREDFNNDKVDAGDIGAGHTVTAIYEITPVGSNSASIDLPRYPDNRSQAKPERNDSEYGFIKLRYKLPKENKSKLIEQVIGKRQSGPNSDVSFSIAVAGFAQLLGNSHHIGEFNYDDVLETAIKNKGEDEYGYRSEFIQLVRMAKIAK